MFNILENEYHVESNVTFSVTSRTEKQKRYLVDMSTGLWMFYWKSHLAGINFVCDLVDWLIVPIFQVCWDRDRCIFGTFHSVESNNENINCALRTNVFPYWCQFRATILCRFYNITKRSYLCNGWSFLGMWKILRFY